MWAVDTQAGSAAYPENHPPSVNRKSSGCFDTAFTRCIGLRARAELLKARRSARTRATTFMLIGALCALGVIGIAATALAALKG
jgi:hypothetical protein